MNATSIQCLALFAILGFMGACPAQEQYLFKESVQPGYQYHVSIRVRINGRLSVPVAPGKPTQLVDMTGDSALEYDERILDDRAEQPAQSLRIYRQCDFNRTTGDRKQQSTLRPEVRRLVLMRKDNVEVPFSPDGPLTWGELDLIRTDVFTPALLSILPKRAVAVGDTWPIEKDAIRELTDLETIDEGTVECTFDRLTTIGGRSLAHLRFRGKVRGVNEDGPNRQSLEGSVYFDLESRHLSYLYLDGVSELLDKEGQPIGRIQGKFTLTRQAGVRPVELSEKSIARLELTANSSNTLLLYDDPELGVQFQYPRHWRVGTSRGTQITIDEARGSGILLTIEPLDKTPTAERYLTESSEILKQYKARILRTTQPERLVGAPHEITRFQVDVELGDQTKALDYLVLRQTLAGATIASQLLMTDRVNLGKDVLAIAKSIRLTRSPGGR